MKTVLGASVALIVLSLSAPAIALEVGGTTLPIASDAALTSALEAEGYTVTKIDRDHDQIEVSVTRDGTRLEIETTTAGLVTEIGLADDD